MTQLTFIAQFVWDNFLNIWPYLLLTIPLAVAVNLSGASKYINRAFQAGPLLAIVLATAVGAFSPFCSCTVIPVVASLLIGGVPLAPVMAFWIASPSMDPEIFLLSVSMLGWELAVWRLAGTVVLSLGAGLLTHLAVQRGWLGADILRRGAARAGATATRSRRDLLRSAWEGVRERARRQPVLAFEAGGPSLGSSGQSAAPATIALAAIPVVAADTGDGAGAGCASGTCSIERPSFRRRLLRETWAATRMVVQFMLLAFLLEALIVLFVPQALIVGLLGGQNAWAVPLAALLGVPVYTSNLTALPLIGGLLAQGMDPAAALAFLIAGPTTTLPAMAAVWGLVRRRVFALYVSFALAGAVVLGVVYALASG